MLINLTELNCLRTEKNVECDYRSTRILILQCSFHRNFSNAFKSTTNGSPSVVGNTWKLSPSIIELMLLIRFDWNQMRSRADVWQEPVFYGQFFLDVHTLFLCSPQYRGADKSLTWPTSRYILFDGDNISFDVSLVILYIYILYIYI